MDKEVYGMNIYIKINDELIKISNEEGFKNIINLVKNNKLSQIEANKIFQLLEKGLKEIGGMSDE
ncbi:hypothetical protein SCORR_v1c05340 [Spiroplasma corruscae]|uniref:Uncharacterized protein n=1 Tax=Spiroplasma corruscae TaxID=216934 RepID=A0A222EPA1_9MOLU|nr:hypothetical protein [Spiroplasma corruscae]ASP28306.1 hypothetical protein SCORR_v1c05340 [Spiroplasma corruscae]